ncbi:hypothetical protein [Capnocytophaga canis]|uniref:hypothetical protein n=1 Tax=Capnocytophaga canis TaxID=1848903 RepID=UPI0037CE8675
MFKVKENIINILQNNIEFRKDLADLRGSDTPSAHRLIKRNSPFLTTLSVMELIRKHTGLSDSEIVEKTEKK